jgi:hypothetical protein
MRTIPEALSRTIFCLMGVLFLAQCSDDNGESQEHTSMRAKNADHLPGGLRRSVSREVRTKGDVIRQQASELEQRLLNLRSELDASSDKSKVINEIQKIINSVRSPADRYPLEDMMIQGLLPGDDPIRDFQWLKDHEGELILCLRDSSGQQGVAFFDRLCSKAGRDIHAMQKGDELLSLVQASSSKERASELEITILSHWVVYGDEFDKIGRIESRELKDSILGQSFGVLEKLRTPQSPEQMNSMIEIYLSEKFEEFQDPGNKVINRLVSKEWYEGEHLKIDGLLGSIKNGAAKDRFLAAVATRSSDVGDGRSSFFVSQIESPELREAALEAVESRTFEK